MSRSLDHLFCQQQSNINLCVLRAGFRHVGPWAAVGVGASYLKYQTRPQPEFLFGADGGGLTSLSRLSSFSSFRSRTPQIQPAGRGELLRALLVGSEAEARSPSRNRIRCILALKCGIWW